MCIACRENIEKRKLIRVVKVSENELKVDETGKANGRGAYICPEIDCLDKAKKINSFSRALDVPMSDNLYNELKRVILRRGL
jgi:uncharacterized protein